MARYSLGIASFDHKGKEIKAKNYKEILQHLFELYPEVKGLISTKGDARKEGEWLNCNVDLAQFSKIYPNNNFVLRRYEKQATIQRGGVTEVADLLTFIMVLNGSINVTTVVGKDNPIATIELDKVAK